jgi:ABC-2 type transport system ATP-binding protein
LQELERLCGTVLLLDKGRLQKLSEVNPPSPIQWDLLTVLLDEQGAKDVQPELESLEGVKSVSCKNKNEYVITYNCEKNRDLDQQLLRVLAQNGWTYRQLSRGQSLEDQLFSPKMY